MEPASLPAPSPGSEIAPRMALEYEALRLELSTNQQFIFERPLVILGVSVAGLLGFENRSEAPIEQIGLLCLVAVSFQSVLFFNLWFTLNRLLSSSRILAYLILVHEGRLRPGWVGWESSLHRYRQWMLKQSHLAEEIQTGHGLGQQYESRRYYAPIFLFHNTLAGLSSLAIVVFALAHDLPRPIKAAVLGFALVVLLAFVVMSWKQWNPRRVRNAVEAELEIWQLVLAPQCYDEPSKVEPRSTVAE